jgi:uncharacterized protein GlcG (DUF336 family)
MNVMAHYTEQRQITPETALRAAEGAILQAGSLGVRINVSVCDASGLPMAFLRMNGAPLHSITISEDKAYTAASFGLPTSKWSQALSGLSESVRLGLPLRSRFVQFGGGLPIFVDGVLIGGIGVSGGSEEQDEICARFGLTLAELDC